MNVIYARYNRHRLPPFQTETTIVALNGVKTVEKKALTPEAGQHIQAMRAGYDLIQRHLRPGRLILPRLTGFDGVSIAFQYIDGPTLDQLLFQSFRAGDKPAFFKIIDDYVALLKEAFPPAAQPNFTAQIKEVFGLDADCPGNGNSGWLPLAVIDAVFENIIISNKSYFLIDNEWVFEGSVPAAFVIFRSLFYFHQVKYFELGIEKWIPFEELLARCQILPEQVSRYHEMDESFQAYVYGQDRCYKYKEQYKKRAIAVHALEQTIAHQREVVRKYHDAILQNERAINEMRNSLSWRLGRKITGVLGWMCPRRLADRWLASIKSRKQLAARR